MVPGANPERRSEVRLFASEKITLFFRDQSSSPAELVDVSAFGFHVRYGASAFPPATLVRASQPQLRILIRAVWSRSSDAQIETGLVEEGYFLRGLRAGDAESFLKLANPYMRSLRARIRCIVRDPAQSEDVMQETLLKALMHAGQFEPAHNFGAWLLQIATNEALKSLRRKRKFREAELPPSEDETGGELKFPAHNLSPADMLERREFRAALASAANSLEETYLRVFLLRDIQGLGMAEVALKLGISIDAANTRLHRAHLRLRSELQRNFFAPGEQLHTLSGPAQEPALPR